MAGQRMKNFSNRPSICAGVTLIVFGVIAIAAEIVRRVLVENGSNCDYSYNYCSMDHELWYLSTGIWCGFVFVVFGLCALIAGKHQSKCWVITHGFFSILAIGFATALIVLSGVNIGLSFAVSPSIRPYKIVYRPCESNDYYNSWRSTPDYWRQWYGGQTTPDYWRQWYGGQTTPDYWRRWYGYQTTPDYWRQWYWGKTTSNWRSWLWDEGRSTTSDRSWIPWIYRRTTPYYYWGDEFRAKSTPDSDRGNWYQDVTTSYDGVPWFQNDQTLEATSAANSGSDFNEDEIYRDLYDERKKRQAVDGMCYATEIHVPWLTQLIMSCLMVVIGIVVFILSTMTATTACLPFYCPPSITHDENTERQVFHDRPISSVFDIESQVPKPETAIPDSTCSQSAAMDIVHDVSAEDVPLLMESSDSEILHV